MNDRKHMGADPYADLTRANAQRKRLGLLVVVTSVVVVALIAVVAVLLSDGGGDEPAAGGTGAAAAANATQQTATVRVAGADLPPLDSATPGFAPDGSDPAVGQRAPVLTGQSFDGSAVTVGGSGAPRMVLFLAHWCPHCQVEVPAVQEWIDSGQVPEGLEIQSVSTAVSADRPNHPPSAWLERERWTPQVLVDDPTGTGATAYGVSGFPFFVLLDPEGNVVQRGSGEIPTSELADAAARLMAASSVSGTPTTVDAG